MKITLRKGDIAWREIDGELVAVDTRSSTYLSANGTGTALWRALADGTTREELVASLVGEYELDERRATADVDAFIAQLQEHGLLDEQ